MLTGIGLLILMVNILVSSVCREILRSVFHKVMLNVG